MRKYALLLLLLFLSSISYAQWPDLSTIEEAIKTVLLSILQGATSLARGLILTFIAYNPTVSDKLMPLYTKLLSLLIPLYLLVLTWNGIQIMTSDVVSTQANARITIQNSVISMVLVASSLQIYQLLINFSQLISSFFVTSAFPDVGSPNFTTLVLYILLAMFLYIFVAFLILRYFFISLGVVLFPLGIFLYFFSPTKKYGKSLISLILFFLFIQIIFALIISVMGILTNLPPQEGGLSGIEEQTYKLCILMGGVLLLILLPTLIVIQILLMSVYPEIKLIGLLRGAGANVKNVE